MNLEPKYEVTFAEVPRRQYCIDGEPVPSVTTVLGILDKSWALTWWAQGIGVKGVLSLADRFNWWADGFPRETHEDYVKWIVAEKLSVNHVKSDAADRGTAVHLAAEHYLTEGTIPDLSQFPDDQRGYVQAFARAMLTFQPTPLASEVIVGSREHGFAGRFDLLCEMDGRRVLMDFKTSKAVYPESHFTQLAAYRMAFEEMYGEHTDAGAVLRLDASGEFEYRESCAVPADFLAVKSAYDAVKRIKKAVSAENRAAKAAVKALGKAA